MCLRIRCRGWRSHVYLCSRTSPLPRTTFPQLTGHVRLLRWATSALAPQGLRACPSPSRGWPPPPFLVRAGAVGMGAWGAWVDGGPLTRSQSRSGESLRRSWSPCCTAPTTCRRSSGPPSHPTACCWTWVSGPSWAAPGWARGGSGVAAGELQRDSLGASGKPGSPGPSGRL